MSGTVLCWLKSYLYDRSQYVKVDGFDSSSISLNYGVPQGSVLGPLLFTFYVSPIEDIIKYHGLDGWCICLVLTLANLHMAHVSPLVVFIIKESYKLSCLLFTATTKYVTVATRITDLTNSQRRIVSI